MKVVIITGASQGIGAEIAKKFAVSQKDIVLILLSRSEEKLQAITNQCRNLGADAYYYICDVTDEDQVKSVAKNILSKWSTVDVLVNNAGFYQPSSFYETTAFEFKSQIDNNLTSAFLVTQAFLPAMVTQKHGDIFFVCSVASLHGYAGGFAYCAAKHGLLGLARTLRVETKDKGIRVISLMPGETLTPAWGETQIASDKFIPADDIANIIVDVHKLDRRTNIDEIEVRPQSGSF